MIRALWLAVLLFPQVNAQISKTPAEVILLRGESPTPIRATTAQPMSRTVRAVFIVVSSDSLVIDGARSALRLEDASPRFEVTLPAGIDADEVRLVRLKSKDGHRSIGYTSSPEHPFSKSDVMAIAAERKDPAQPRAVIVKTAAPLKPGEYALLIDARFFDFGIN
jgi:hypothetical protein